MITFVTWKWHDPRSQRRFLSLHVNVLYAMIARRYSRPFRFICITDDPAGLSPQIRSLPLPVRFADLQSPHGDGYPNCYCRLWNFSREAAACLGERIFQIDIDCVIIGDLFPLIDRQEDFVGWTDKRFQQNKLAGGAYLLRTGAFPEVWEDFRPDTSPAEAFAAGTVGSDQGWLSHKLARLDTIGTWRNAGLVKINWTPPHIRRAPPGARIVFTNGLKPPWANQTQQRYPWVRDYWKL